MSAELSWMGFKGVKISGPGRQRGPLRFCAIKIYHCYKFQYYESSSALIKREFCRSYYDNRQ